MKDIQKYDFKEGLPHEFEVLQISQLYQNFFEEISTPHRAQFYQLIWFQKGAPTHMVDFNHIPVIPNTLLFVNKNSVQRFDSEIISSGKSILFTDSFFCKTKEDTNFLRSSILFNDLLSISAIEITKYIPLFDNLFTQIETESLLTKDQYQSDILHSFLRTILLLSEREWRKQGFSEIKISVELDYVIQFKDLVENQFPQKKLVRDYANEMCITVKRLNNAISKVLGKTPKQMIDARIMLEAKRLLVYTTESVKEIGFTLGYAEPTNFIKFFKKHQIATPIEFRDSFKP